MQVTHEYIGNGDDAIYYTVSEMIRLAIRDSKSPEIKQIAQEIEKKCNDNDLCKAMSVWQYVYDNVKYKYDHENVVDYCNKENNCSYDVAENTEFLISPKYLITHVKKGDCDDMSMLVASICLAFDKPLETNFRIIAWKDNDFSHVYPEVKVNLHGQDWFIPVDVVIKKFGTEKAPIIRAESYKVKVKNEQL